MPTPTPQEPQELDQQGIDSLTGFVEDYVSAGLGDLNYAVTELPQFLADDSPVTTAALFPRSVLRSACRNYARGGGPQNLPGFDAAWGGICGPYLESIGEEPDSGSLAPPFTGGQCPINYLVWGQIDGTDLQIGGLTPINMVGPLRPAGRRDVPAPGQPFSDSMRTFFDFNTGNGLQSVGVPWRLSFPSSRTYRVDPQGQADNCGNPPTEYKPPSVKPGLPPLTPEPIDIPGIGPTPISVEFNPQGQIVVNLPDVGIEVPVDAPIDISLGGDGEPGGGGEAPPPGDVGQPGSPALSDPGGETEGTAPEGSVLVGIRCEILAFPDSRNKYTSEVFRGAYYAYMGVPGLLDLDFGGAMVRQDQFLFAEKENLTSWRVSANTNYVIRTTPYYRSVE